MLGKEHMLKLLRKNKDLERLKNWKKILIIQKVEY